MRTSSPPEQVMRDRHRDPYSYFSWLRENEPVHAEMKPNGLRVWQVTRYADVHDLLTDSRLSKRPELATAPLGQTVPAYADGAAGLYRHLLHTDPPEHTRLRRLANRAFSPRRVAVLAPMIRQRAERLAGAFPAHGDVDVLASFAFPLTFATICTILGVPHHLRTERFRELAAVTLQPSYAGTGVGAMSELHAYLTDLVRHKRRENAVNEEGDLLGALVTACDRGDQLSEQELISTAYLLLTVGHDTTMNLIGNGMLALLRHPRQLRCVAEASTTPPIAVEELLRYDSPARKATFRVAVEDLRLHGTVIPRGEIVSLAIGSANRDQAQFADAAELNVKRTPNEHLSFGRGPHFCIGAALARLESEIAFDVLLQRMRNPQLAIPPDHLSWRPSQVMRGLASLPIRFER
ncbi:cytochrome P450 [Amycolatopsis sp. NPDC049868]|uniref:cytochrome P450 n=1 Tax=Amycolatopsis sp. NPDC049868 TaxID=3363934 RepID=UPI0037B5D79B